jgi:hypothetical protein
MESSRSLAGLIGPTLLAAGLALLINRPLFSDMLLVAGHDPLLVMLAGFITFVIGIAILRVHNVWRGWPVLVTLVGWVALVTGLLRILFPIQIAGIAAKFTSLPLVVPLIAVLCLVAGGILAYKAYARSSQ